MFLDSLLSGSLFALGLGSLLFFTFFISMILIIVLFLYKAFAFYTIAKKLGSKYGFLAFIPIGQLFLYPILAKERWGWALIPLLLITLPLFFMPFSIIPFINLFLIFLIIIGTVVLLGFRTFWYWKIFQKRNYNGALSILTLVSLIDLIVIGFVAWNDVDKKTKQKIEKVKINKKSLKKKKSLKLKKK